jgi:hypothetical protein
MGLADGPPVSAGSGPAFLPSPGRGAPGGATRYRGQGNRVQDATWKPRRCILAAGVAVAVVLCMSWAHTFRVPSGFAVLNGHVVETVALIRPAGTGNGGCAAESALAASQLQGEDLIRRGLSELRQQPVRVFLAAYVRSQKSATDSPDPEQRPNGAPGIRVQGGRAIIAVPGTACRSVGFWFRAGHLAVSFLPPYGHARHGIGVLAFRGWAAEGPIRSKRDGCVADEVAERTQGLDAAVLDPRKGEIVRISRADYFQETSSGNPALICVMIRANQQDAGASNPESWCGAYGASGGQVGSGDRASLPGRSTRYRVIWLVCPRCGDKMACLFYDEGDRPLCENSPHGRMEVLR